MVKVEGAKNFGIGLGLIVEDALFAVRLDFTIFQVEIECEGSIFLHDDQVTVIDLGCPLTEQHAAGGNAVLLIAMSIGHNAKTLFGDQTRKSIDLDGAIAIAQNGVSGLSRFNCCVYSQYLLSDT